MIIQITGWLMNVLSEIPCCFYNNNVQKDMHDGYKIELYQDFILFLLAFL